MKNYYFTQREVHLYGMDDSLPNLGRALRQLPSLRLVSGSDASSTLWWRPFIEDVAQSEHVQTILIDPGFDEPPEYWYDVDGRAAEIIHFGHFDL